MSQLPVRFHCRHVHLSGHRCGSPALRNEPFCYYHHTTRRPAPRRQPTFQIPILEDRATLQLAIAEVLTRIAEGTLEPRRAGLLLYGLQIAQNNLPPHRNALAPADTIEDLTLDQLDQPLAPEQEFQTAPHERTLEEILVEQWEKDKAQAAQDEAERQARFNEFPATIPAIQACSGNRKTHNSPLASTRHSRSHKPYESRRTGRSNAPAGSQGRCCLEHRLCRRSPNLPHTYACSTIGPTRLNFRVRDGNGCDPRGKLTGKV